MPANHLKIQALNLVDPINVNNETTKESIIDWLTQRYRFEDQSLFSKEKITQQVEHLITTRQIIINHNGIAFAGVGLFEEAEPVSDKAQQIAQSIFAYVYEHSKLGETARDVDSYIVEEIINTMAVITDKHISPDGKPTGKISSKSITKDIIENLNERRGFRLCMEDMNKSQLRDIFQSMTKIADTHLLKNQLNDNLEQKNNNKTLKI